MSYQPVFYAQVSLFSRLPFVRVAGSRVFYGRTASGEGFASGTAGVTDSEYSYDHAFDGVPFRFPSDVTIVRQVFNPHTKVTDEGWLIFALQIMRNAMISSEPVDVIAQLRNKGVPTEFLSQDKIILAPDGNIWTSRSYNAIDPLSLWMVTMAALSSNAQYGNVRFIQSPFL